MARRPGGPSGAATRGTAVIGVIRAGRTRAPPTPAGTRRYRTMSRSSRNRDAITTSAGRARPGIPPVGEMTRTNVLTPAAHPASLPIASNGSLTPEPHMQRPIRKIALNTGGGDAPGLNAVIRAAVLAARSRGWEVYGIRRGYGGLLEDDSLVRLDKESVRGITHLGGTILGTTNRGNPFEWPVQRPDGTVEVVDRSDEVIEAFHRHELDALIAIGGDGSLHIANRLAK